MFQLHFVTSFFFYCALVLRIVWMTIKVNLYLEERASLQILRQRWRDFWTDGTASSLFWEQQVLPDHSGTPEEWRALVDPALLLDGNICAGTNWHQKQEWTARQTPSPPQTQKACINSTVEAREPTHGVLLMSFWSEICGDGTWRAAFELF